MFKPTFLPLLLLTATMSITACGPESANQSSCLEFAAHLHALPCTDSTVDPATQCPDNLDSEVSKNCEEFYQCAITSTSCQDGEFVSTVSQDCIACQNAN